MKISVTLQFITALAVIFTNTVSFKPFKSSIKNSKYLKIENSISGYHSTKPLFMSEATNNPFFKSDFYKLLPILSIILSTAGICFQIFVLYPWHEELSFEFKDLENAIIRLDKVLETRYSNVEDISHLNLKRPTGRSLGEL